MKYHMKRLGVGKLGREDVLIIRFSSDLLRGDYYTIDNRKGKVVGEEIKVRAVERIWNQMISP